MEEEAGSAPGGYRYSMMSKISSYRRDFEQLRKDLVRLNTICRVDRFSCYFSGNFFKLRV